MLVFGLVFKRALGSFWVRFWVNLRRFGMDFGRVGGGFWEGLEGFGEGFGRILELLGKSLGFRRISHVLGHIST